MEVLFLFILDNQIGDEINKQILKSLQNNKDLISLRKTSSKTQLSIPFYSLNDQTTSLYPLFCSKLTIQKQKLIDQVNIYILI